MLCVTTVLMATRSVFVLATVVSVRDKSFYPCCTRCHKKVHTGDDEAIFSCGVCQEEYSAEHIQYRYRISAVASDRTQLAQITVFGSCLDRFFGTPATNFARFVNRLKVEPLPIPWNRLIHQAVEQCFVGSLLQFGFRVYSPSRTTSQITRNSPFHLKNIVKKQCTSENTSSRAEGLPSLLACQILPCSSPEQQGPTVLQILNENLQELRRSTPLSFSVRSSQHSPLIRGSQTQASCETQFATKCTSLQGNRASPIYCTPQEFCSTITHLVLTGSSQPCSGTSILMQEKSLETDVAKLALLHPCLGLEDQGDRFSSHNKDSSGNSNFPLMPQFATPGVLESRNLHTNFVDDSKQLQTSCEWAEYDDFPSSEDLSAFLADLERDAVIEEAGKTLPTRHSKNGLQPPVVIDRMTPHMTSGEVTSDLMTSKIATLKDVVCRLSQTPVKEDCTEFDDFPSSEDLDAFLADMDLDCDYKPQKKSLAPTVELAEAFQSKRHNKAEEPRTLASNEHLAKGIVDRNHTKYSNRILKLDNPCDKEDSLCNVEMSIDSFCVPGEFWKPSFASKSDKRSYDVDSSSDSQFLRDCESVLTKFNENACIEKDRTDSKLGSHWPILLQNDFALSNKESTRQTKHLCGSGSAEELHKESIVCNMPLKQETSNIIRSHDRDTNETEVQQGDPSICNRWTLVGHYGNNEESKCGNEMLHNSFEMMSCSGDLFSQSLSRMEENCSKTSDLFSSPRLFNGESRSCCIKHLSVTPDLFPSPRSPSSHTHSRSRQEMNSVSLFSCSDHSHLASSSPFPALVRSTSLPGSSENEADAPPTINHRGNENSQTVSFYSTPYRFHLPSKILHKAWTPAGVSPMISDSRGRSPCNDDISVQGTPVLFSPLSNSSL